MTLNENSDIEVKIWISRWPRHINGWTGYFAIYKLILLLVLLSLLYTVMRIGSCSIFIPIPPPSLG